MSFQGHIEKGMVVLNQPLPFPDGTPVRVEPVVLTSVANGESLSLVDLAKQQRIAIPRSVDELMGGWPADEVNDGFQQALEQWRRSESEQAFDG
jgi:hypothetical protein